MLKSSLHLIRFSVSAAGLLLASAQALAQQPPAQPPKDGIQRMEEIQVERITPDQLPQGRLNEDPRRVIQRPKRLPRAPTEEDLKRLGELLKPRVVEVMATYMPPQPYRQVPMLYRGHAIWVSAKEDGADPVLVTTQDWLKGAQEIYMVPPSMARQDNAKLGHANIVTLESMGSNKELERFEKNKSKYIPLTLEQPDKWRNLTGLKGAKGLPGTGLKLLDLANAPVGYLYGYSPIAGGGVVPTTMLQKAPEQEALSYYWQTTYNAVLGAPLVDEDGEVVILNAMRHPSQEGFSLAIPPGALRYHVRQLQGIPQEPVNPLQPARKQGEPQQPSKP